MCDIAGKSGIDTGGGLLAETYRIAPSRRSRADSRRVHLWLLVLQDVSSGRLIERGRKQLRDDARPGNSVASGRSPGDGSVRGRGWTALWAGG